MEHGEPPILPCSGWRSEKNVHLGRFIFISARDTCINESGYSADGNLTGNKDYDRNESSLKSLVRHLCKYNYLLSRTRINFIVQKCGFKFGSTFPSSLSDSHLVTVQPPSSCSHNLFLQTSPPTTTRGLLCWSVCMSFQKTHLHSFMSASCKFVMLSVHGETDGHKNLVFKISSSDVPATTAVSRTTTVEGGAPYFQPPCSPHPSSKLGLILISTTHLESL